MRSSQAYATLRAAGVQLLRTAEVATLLRQSPQAASKTLSRLADSGLVVAIRPGVWWTGGPVHPHQLAEGLALPFPSYLSLHSALHLRAMIEQIPAITYVVTLGRSRRLRTPAGAFSFHHITPELFGGFDDLRGVRVAQPEKALFDLVYLAGGRSRLKARVPELSLPRDFRQRRLEAWIARVTSARGRTLIRARLDQVLGSI